MTFFLEITQFWNTKKRLPLFFLHRVLLFVKPSWCHTTLIGTASGVLKYFKKRKVRDTFFNVKNKWCFCKRPRRKRKFFFILVLILFFWLFFRSIYVLKCAQKKRLLDVGYSLTSLLKSRSYLKSFKSSLLHIHRRRNLSFKAWDKSPSVISFVLFYFFISIFIFLTRKAYT